MLARVCWTPFAAVMTFCALTVIDLHSHLLPGLDDGAPDLAAAVELVRAAQAAGVTRLAATPHVRDDYPTRPAAIQEGLETVRAALGGATIELIAGAELAVSYLHRLSDDELAGLTLGGGRYALIELPYTGWFVGTELALGRLRDLGIQPLLAHPERNDLIRERPERLEVLVAAGAIVQLTARSTHSGSRSPAAAAARALLNRGLVHVVASDAHAPSPAGRRSPWQVDLPDRLRERFCVENPAAILAGEPVEGGIRRRSLVRRLRRH